MKIWRISSWVWPCGAMFNEEPESWNETGSRDEALQMVPIRVRHVTMCYPWLQNTISLLIINQILRKRYYKKAYLVRNKSDFY